MGIGLVSVRSVVRTGYYSVRRIVEMVRRILISCGGNKIVLPSGVSRVFGLRARSEVGYVPSALVGSNIYKVG